MKLVDTAALKVIEENKAPRLRLPAAATATNLLSRWWYGDTPPGQDAMLDAEVVKAAGIKLTPKANADPKVAGWRRGMVDPPLYVPAGNVKVEVRLQAENPAAGARAKVVCYSASQPIATVEADLTKARAPHTFSGPVGNAAPAEKAPNGRKKQGKDPAVPKPRIEATYIDYMSITTDGTPVVLHSVTVVPAR